MKPETVWRIASRSAARDERDQTARTALIDDDRQSRAAIALAAYPHSTGQAVIVALRQAHRPVWAPGVRILDRPPISRTDRVQIRRSRRFGRTIAIAGRVRWGGREPRRRQPPYRKSSGGQVAAHHSQRDRTEVPNRPSQRPGSVLAEGRRRCCSCSVDPRSTACGTSLEPTASSGSWIATSLLSVRLIVSSMLWVACGAETAVITARSPGALAGRTPAELGRLTGWRA